MHPAIARIRTQQRIDHQTRSAKHPHDSEWALATAAPSSGGGGRRRASAAVTPRRLALLVAFALLFLLAFSSRALALQQKVATGGELLGFSAAVDGDTLVLGDPADAKGTGAVWVFRRVGDTWIQSAKLTASDGSSGDVLGASVAIRGNTILAGAPSDTVGTHVSQGSVYTFAREGTAERTQTAKLTAAEGSAGEKLGSSVAVDGGTIVAGAPSEPFAEKPQAGLVYTFAREGAVARTQTAKLTAAEGSGAIGLGSAVAINGDTIVASAPEETVGANARQGAVYTFSSEGAAARTPTAELSVAEGGTEELLGISVAIDGPTIVAGAPRDAVRGRANQGAVYTFERTGAGKRTETARLTASDGAAVDELGTSVSISGATIVAGAPFHMVGANKQQGAAYTFASTGATARIQTSRLIDPEGAAEALLGFSVATDGSTVVAGAPFEGSASVFFSPAPPAPPFPPPASPPTPSPTSLASPPPPPPAKPVLSRLGISPHVLHLRPHSPNVSTARRGVRITFALSASSRVGLSFAKAEPGRRGAGTCQPQKRSNRMRARCTRLVAIGSFSVQGHAGSNSVLFAGRLSRASRLAPGSYTVTARTIEGGHATGPARTAKLTVIG